MTEYLRTQLDAARAERDRLLATARKLRDFLAARYASHYECDDCWYSCPKADGCDDRETDCNCGKDKADALLTSPEVVALGETSESTDE